MHHGLKYSVSDKIYFHTQICLSWKTDLHMKTLVVMSYFQIGEVFPFRNMYGILDPCRECECLNHEQSQCYIKQECYTTPKPTSTMMPCMNGCMLSDGSCVPVSIIINDKMQWKWMWFWSIPTADIIHFFVISG
jgi:hypothetical protein